ncbi:uncharacterized protein L201_005420 [Kwoniella dendrophila CBS 6074]|uniref:Ribosomal protein S9 n=1 Tax=Kwoniella dendrophila CBS 6074 TaxID=1295534 RepID=A0AAX4K015_9TREE
MALPTASTSIRSLRAGSLQIFQASIRGYATIQPYSPSPLNTTPDHAATSYISTRRPNRPTSTEFFTGRPKFNESLLELNLTIENVKKKLRKNYIYPLPTHLQHLTPTQTNWISKEEFSNYFDIKLKTNTLRQVMELLNELNNLRFISDLSNNKDQVNKINQILYKYERHNKDSLSSSSSSSSSSISNAESKEQSNGIDKFGRAYSMGRKKTSSSRVWLIPSKTLLSSQSSATNDITSSSSVTIPDIKSEILINHIPLSQYFIRPSDRETILRPLKITGYLGAFNIFGFSRGGGMSGQASAVGLAVSRALSILRDDAKDILQADGALMRDTRMTERKKTGRAKARKGYTWVKR